MLPFISLHFNRLDFGTNPKFNLSLTMNLAIEVLVFTVKPALDRVRFIG